ncbi:MULTISPECIES: hypothetical protein [Streptomyces]|uniref:Uncharacterized protein n=1 Tax=Streptomyces venezuelae (strain ATCC 10712 / CBS 650.69 / DSM 40230 / JCM 4526 / NBRC 13096 / PD 04745) TaxID=953739 RepID=F2R0T9_STRVP|nr:hypothetical protein [Streptomyces venezuelae]APE21430.1 hypothetical protein vnz_10600 [Streptomyces venezuelae]QER98817.1 hypothetical protein DEJ43_10745 [Streptomyces venezuelae ATCC 10712]CCA55456.1 hypothetical protein SVEN_2170 [Streptomyces venezuelae ATCC 10712]
MPIKLSDELIQIQQAAVDAQREAQAGPYSAEAWTPWLEAATVIQAAITEHAKATGQSRFDVEAEVKLAVLNPEGYAEKKRKEAEKAKK